MNPSTIQVKVANNMVSDVIGITNPLSIEFDQISDCCLKLLVIDHDDHEVLLGLDWFRKTGAGLLPRENAIWTPGTMVKLDKVVDENSDEEENSCFSIEELDKDELSAEMEWDFSQDALGMTNISPGDDNVLKPKEIKEFLEIRKDINSVVAKEVNELKACNLRAYSIKLSDPSPIYLPPYRKSIHEREVLKVHIKEMLEGDIIEESNSPWSAPVIMIPKKDKTLRMCVDYRRLNAVTIKEIFPIPRISDIFDNLSDSEWFTTIDLKSGYWQIR